MMIEGYSEKERKMIYDMEDLLHKIGLYGRDHISFVMHIFRL